MSKHGLITPPFFKIGKYFYNDPKHKKNGEFDVVTYDQKGYISYKCKFTNDSIDNDLISEEKRQISNADLPCYKLGFVSKNGFSKGIEKNGLNLYSLEDFYDEKLKD